MLGFQLSDTVVDGPIFAHFYHVNGRHHSLAIARSPNDRPAFLHLMVEVNSLEDVGRALDLCEERNVPVTRTLGCHTNDQMTSFYLHSPSNFRVEYGWGGLEVDELWEPRYYDRTSTWGHKHQHKELSPFLDIAAPKP
ncbi:3-methylcatechol 2,3-dioxygenase [bioreactor metagenome]|uniref:3-methylcatechol 2,3-dioxygenase n=1 Tax=bioreactor metagenome TaxID=1076179 RepID=A0A644ZTP9_9ZZZZ